MINNTLLKDTISSKGLKLQYISNQLGITRQAFGKKLNGNSPITTTEAQKLAVLLGLSKTERDAIFFPNHVDETTTKE